VYNLLDTPRTPEIRSRLFLTDDPALVVLYSQLRQQTVQTLRGASKVSPYTEWQFVLHSAKIYDRMGCDFLGLDLGESPSALHGAVVPVPGPCSHGVVRNWEFLHAAAGHPGKSAAGSSSLQLSKRRASTVAADLEFSGMQAGHGSAGQARQVATVDNGLNQTPLGHEPDAESFLDSFGF
jgi:hypothetical protein